MRAINYQQRGMSLISIMIGMLLSMITILSSLVLYRTLSHTSIDSRIDAAIDGEIATAMLTLQLEIQAAGFGYESTTPPHVLVEAGANPTYVYWRYKDTTPATPLDTCRGLRIKDISASHRQLQLLKSTTCNESSELSSFTWTDPSNVLSVLADIKVKTGQKLPKVGLKLESKSCFPYGMSAVNTYQHLTVTLDNAARRAALDDTTLATPNTPFIYTFCLSNTTGASPGP
ncbi:MAG: hypothetical protein U5M23_12940 [Marinagarivorans sp.]|nr:hypothetical protein [Marinagarivorans sp.]